MLDVIDVSQEDTKNATKYREDFVCNAKAILMRCMQPCTETTHQQLLQLVTVIHER